MVIEPIHDPMFLGRISTDATAEDAPIADDLLDTLKAYSDTCVGMAANMIGKSKRIIAINDGGAFAVMFNPVIIKQEGAYDTEENCLSLLGGPRKTKRYKSIKVSYQDRHMKPRVKKFTGFTAQIIQHEIDHCNGILI